MPSPVEGEGLKSRFERDEVPAIVMRVSEDMKYPPGRVFTVYPTESERFAILADYIMEELAGGKAIKVRLYGYRSLT
jgi:hypothetical protein